jgi:DNA-nicking Smr family endonuclease
VRPAAPPADRSAERRVKRGQIEIHAKFDLHGHTQDSGHAALVRFLRAAAARGERVVIVVTGKGGRLVDGSPSPGVLRQRAPEWLAGPELRAFVSGFAPAHRRHGGEGALYVFLRRPA